MQKLRLFEPRVSTLDTRAVKQQRVVDPYYQSQEHRLWRDQVVAKAGGQCEAIDRATGLRCTKAEPRHRMFADHITERRDGGANLGPGQCLCGAHHAIKTSEARAARFQMG